MLATTERDQVRGHRFTVVLTAKGADGAVRDGKVSRAGDVLELSPWEANALVRRGEA